MNFIANAFKSLISLLILAALISTAVGAVVIAGADGAVMGLLAAAGGLLATIVVFGILAITIQNNLYLERITRALEDTTTAPAANRRNGAPAQSSSTLADDDFLSRFPVRKDPPVT